jgi:hypothetical protein
MVSSHEEIQNEVQSIFLLPVVHLECPPVADNNGPRLRRWGSNRTPYGMSKRGNAATDFGTRIPDKVRNTFQQTFLIGYYCLQIGNGPPGFSTLQRQKLEKQLVRLPPLPI